MIRIVSTNGVPAHAFEWTWGQDGSRGCTVVAKATFSLREGRAELASRHEPIALRAIMTADGARLVRPSDVVPFKKNVDVLVAGISHRASPERALRIEGRPLRLHDVSATGPARPFAEGQRVSPEIGPADFQSVPIEQQVEALALPFELSLENLLPRTALLKTTLPAMALRARLDDSPVGSLALRVDTVVIDLEAVTCSVTFRGWQLVDADRGPLLLQLEDASKVERTAHDDTMTKEIVAPWIERPLPFAGAPPSAERRAADVAPVAERPRRRESEAVVVRTAAIPAVPISAVPPPPVVSSPPAAAPKTAQQASDEAARSRSAEDELAPRRTIGRAAEPDPVPVKAGPALELLWVDEARNADIRTSPRLARVFASRRTASARRVEPPSRDLESDTLRAMAEGEALPMGRAAAEVDPTGEQRVTRRPLELVVGQLVFLFDERKRLEAAVAFADALPGANKQIRDAVQTGRATLENAWALGATLDGAFEHVRESVGRVSASSHSLFEAQTTRALLERRAFRMRTALGRSHVRAELVGEAGERLPIFLPETLRDVVPLCERMSVRALVEVRHALDVYDAPQAGLVVAALARQAPGVAGA